MGLAADQLACELLHLPGKPAGVEREGAEDELADELAHLPGKPAGVATGNYSLEWERD
jgi:hypothetical protein